MKLVFVLLFTLLTLPAFSQDSRFSLGFYLEAPYRINRIKSTNEHFDKVNHKNKLGFAAGWMSNYQLNGRFALRAKLGVNFEKYEISFMDNDIPKTIKKDENLLIGSISGVIKTNNKIPLNAVIGIEPALRLGNKKDPDELNLKKFDFAGKIGLSYTIQLEHFRMAPEITYSRGFVNASGNKNIYQQALEKYYCDRVSFSVSFY